MNMPTWTWHSKMQQIQKQIHMIHVDITRYKCPYYIGGNLENMQKDDKGFLYVWEIPKEEVQNVMLLKWVRQVQHIEIEKTNRYMYRGKQKRKALSDHMELFP